MKSNHHVDDSFNQLNPLYETKQTPANKPNQDSNQLCNRLMLCFVAIVVLWATSLQSAVTLVNYFVPAPPFVDAYSECENTWQVVELQQNMYSECVRVQLHACNSAYAVGLSREVHRVSVRAQANAAHVTNIESYTSNITTIMTLLKNSLAVWNTLGVSNIIPYNYNNNTCSVGQLAAARAFIGDTTPPSGSIFYRDFTSYAGASDAAVASIGSYSESLVSYNRQYVNNKTQSLQRAATQIARSVSIPRIAALNETLATLQSTFRDVISCISLSGTGVNSSEWNVNCSLPTSVLQEYEYIRTVANVQLSEAADTFLAFQSVLLSFESEVSRALSQADAFYDSIQGLVADVSDTLHKLGVNVDLCASGSWCDYSKVRSTKISLYCCN